MFQITLKSIMRNRISAVKVSLEEMQQMDIPRRIKQSKVSSLSNSPYVFVFGKKVYIQKADIQIYISAKFEIHY